MCVFNVDGADDYYIAFLEFGRNSTNRQTYVNHLYFNDDGTIRQVDVSLDGVGALHPVTISEQIIPKCITSSSVASPHLIRYFKDSRCQRTEQFAPEFAIDNANGSRWMADEQDISPWLMIDLGMRLRISTSEVYFVRPSAGHAYTLEGSQDGKRWEMIDGHEDIRKKSPHTDIINRPFRYLRINIKEGIKGIYEWKIR